MTGSTVHQRQLPIFTSVADVSVSFNKHVDTANMIVGWNMAAGRRGSQSHRPCDGANKKGEGRR